MFLKLYVARKRLKTIIFILSTDFKTYLFWMEKILFTKETCFFFKKSLQNCLPNTAFFSIRAPLSPQDILDYALPSNAE